MITRVTQQMMNNTFMRNLEANNRQMEKLQSQLATGKSIVLPGDDPVVAARAMFFRSNLTEANKYVDNASKAQLWLDTTEGALHNSTEALHRVRELLVTASSDATSVDARRAIAKEIEQMKEHIKEIANTSVAGRHIFAGTHVHNEPAHVGPDGKIEWVGNDGFIELEIGMNNLMTLNISGSQIFKVDDKSIFDVLDEVTTKLLDGNTPSNEISSYLSKVDDFMNNTLDYMAEIGARQNRLDFTIHRLEGLILGLEEAKSNAEDVNAAKVITELQMQENVYRASLSVGARIIQPSLVDFLR
ncbi:flagellar hook-associated protein FlgL [Heliorestis convoluta]|uniref:Flagellar hook-associated protein 3 n=1 Tax=Heliorestis convoluta TaxID=356322 RepID=A0A5Q2N114_9FIRM|nr:flagellar hook-associated protein FlgL [Heliorestis convoluta]QGG47483.1 flagellar hook-associated protein 3 [Heliorestis convoluta]